MNTLELKEFVALEEEKAGLKTRLKAIESRLDELDQSLTKQFLDDGIQSTKIDGRTVYLHRDIYASPKTDKTEVVEALKNCDLGQYVREDYNANSLKAFVREMVHAAEEAARAENRVIEDLASAVDPQLAATLNISAVYSVSSRRS